MISKIIPPGKSFAGLCRYLFQNKENALVILSEGIRDYDHEKMAADFTLQASQNTRLKSPVLHAILSWPPGENIGAELMTNIVKEYLENLRLLETQFAVIKHIDKEHQHVHLVVNRVSNSGKTINDSYIGLRGKKIAQQLTLKYGLEVAQEKHLSQTNLYRLHGNDAVRYEIFAAVYGLLPTCANLNELQERLSRQHIQVVYKYKGQSKDVQGISFCKGDLKFKGSEIDRAFSYGNLQNLFVSKKQKQSLHKHRHSKPEILQQYDGKPLSETTKLLYELMRPEFIPDFNPDQAAQARKRRKKSQGL